MGNLMRSTARFAIPATQQQHGHKQLTTDPMTHMTAPIIENTNAINANGNPIKNPTGRQSPSPIFIFGSNVVLYYYVVCVRMRGLNILKAVSGWFRFLTYFIGDENAPGKREKITRCG